MDNLVLRQKGAKRPTKLKREVLQGRDREATDHVLPSTSSSEDQTVEDAVRTLLKKLKFFQDRAHATNAVKAKAHRRLMFGLREVTRDCRAGVDVRAVIVANDIEMASSNELFLQVAQLHQVCSDRGLPVVKCASRRKLSRWLAKPGAVAAVGVYNVAGAEELFDAVLAAERLRNLITNHVDQTSFFP